MLHCVVSLCLSAALIAPRKTIVYRTVSRDRVLKMKYFLHHRVIVSLTWLMLKEKALKLKVSFVTTDHCSARLKLVSEC